MDLSTYSLDELKVLKKKYEQEVAQNHNRQMAMKILLNSGYGALANMYFRWYQSELAESITLSGQLSVRWIERHLNKFLNGFFGTTDVDYVIAVDTDSCYLNLEPYVEKNLAHLSDTKEIVAALDDFAKGTVQPVIDEGFNELYKEMNVYEETMDMKREAIADAGVWVAKKRYVLSVWNNEGVSYDSPQIKMQGIDAVRSSTPQVCRNWIKEAIPLITTRKRDELIRFIDDCETKFRQMPFEAVASPRTANNLEKYYDVSEVYIKATPIGVRGALLYNYLLKQNSLTNLYQPIRSGDKIRFCYLKLPNPIRENVIAVPDELPEELGLAEYIDYDLQFEKTFNIPLTHIINSAHISTENIVDLEQFFS